MDTVFALMRKDDKGAWEAIEYTQDPTAIGAHVLIGDDHMVQRLTLKDYWKKVQKPWGTPYPEFFTALADVEESIGYDDPDFMRRLASLTEDDYQTFVDLWATLVASFAEHFQDSPVQDTWTFFGHWDNGEIVVDFVLAGEHQDERQDVGHYDEGLFAASGKGATQDEALAAVRAEYEHQND